ncbi:30S ribosomal protein S1 [Reyranella sp.]|uniref:30S ribosomal protein S1 n=1 Tax=Reyranella sp. TaxID=1929291 RepID=UPI003F6E9411
MAKGSALRKPANDTSSDEFAALLDESLGGSTSFEGQVVKGRVIRIANDFVTIDVGLKSEGRVALREFANGGTGAPEVKEGDTVDIFVDRMENKEGEAVLSRDKARREEAWTVLEKAFTDQERVMGTIFGRVKGGFTVDLSGAVAFLPGSQVDVRPVRDVGPLMGQAQQFAILKMDRRRGNIVVSRRAVMEETRAEDRTRLMGALSEGQVLDGVVKNITDYGAFVDLGGVDGLLHVTDIAWKRINHPSEALTIGQQVKVQVVRFNPETQRISLGMKQLMSDPWDGAGAKYPVNLKLKGRVTNITDYGAFVELEPGVEGLVHVSEMSWTKKNVHPGKIVSTSQEVEVMVLDVDMSKRRISLGLKQCMANPWESFAEQFPAGTELEGEVRNITEFGLFVGLPGDIDGMVHLSDLSWDKAGDEAIRDFKKGDQVKVKVLDVDMDKERISLGIKQLANDPFEKVGVVAKKGDVVTVIVAGIQDNGIDVTVQDGIPGFIRKTELSRDRSEQRPDRYAIGDKLDAKITNIDKASRRVVLSVKARELDEEKKAMADFGSSDSGASLGDILGAALKKRAEAGDDEDK